MIKTPEPRDCLSNILSVGSLVAVHFVTPPVFKIAVVESGGISTPNGTTPALIRIICDLTLRQAPGVPFIQLVRVVSPSEQEMAERVASLLHST